MGLDVSVGLVIGVPLLCLGHVEEEGREVPLFNVTGQKTGKTAKVNTAYLVTPKGRFEIGSNLDAISEGRRYTRIQFRYANIPLPDDEDEWIHISDREATSPDKVIVGLCPNLVTIVGEQEESWDRLESFSMYSLESVAQCATVVQEVLERCFGYSEQICAISQAHYSY